MSNQSGRPGRWLRAVATAVVAAVVLLLLFNAAQRHASAPFSTSSASATPASRADPVTPPVVQPPQREAPAAHGSGRRIEVCGFGEVQTTGLSFALPAEIDAALANSTVLAQAVAQLGASGDPVDRAVALRYEALRIEKTADLAGRVCGGNEACEDAARESAGHAAAPYVQALAQLAQQTRDPIAFAFATLACRGPSAPAACVDVNARGWAEVESDNGAAWLYVAYEARARNDTAAVAAALARAAEAQRFDLHATELFRPLTQPAARQAPERDRIAIQTTVIGLYSAVPYVGYMELPGACKPDGNANHRAMCEQLATRLIETDTSLLGISIGQRIGENLRWPAERIAAVEAERHALAWLQSRDFANPDTILSCRSLAAMETRSLDMLRRGEVGTLRDALRRSGRTPAQLAQEWRDFVSRNARPRPPQ